MSSAGTPTADSVRLALPAEAEAIAAVQRRSWLSDLTPEVGQAMLGAATVTEMAQAWHAAIARPPQARCRVLVGVEQGRVVGFATTLPSGDADADPARDGAVEEFAVDPPARRRGHGSRLLNACVDTLRADGFVRATCWVPADDDGLHRFFAAAGWAPDGSAREIGSEDEAVRLAQVRMHCAIA